MLFVSNATGMNSHRDELDLFLNANELLLHLLRSTLRYDYWIHRDHPDASYGGATALVGNTLNHHQISFYQREFIQSTAICINLAAVYCPLNKCSDGLPVCRV